MKIIYNKKYEKNAPAENLPEQNKISFNNNSNITLKELLVIFIVSLLIFSVCILVQSFLI